MGLTQIEIYLCSYAGFGCQGDRGKEKIWNLATTISASDIQKIQHNCHFSFYHLSSQRELQWNEGFPTLTQHSLFVCLCLTVSYSDQTVFCQNLEHALKSLSCTSNFGSVSLACFCNFGTVS